MTSCAVEATHFQLYKRAKHVFSEALRVLQFRAVCLAAAASPSTAPPAPAAQTLNEPALPSPCATLH